MGLFLDVFILLDTVRTVLFGGATSRVRKVESTAMERIHKLNETQEDIPQRKLAQETV
jgi:hypothetical protein